jgi:dihydrofolate reductase
MGRGAYDLGDQFDGFADTPYKCVHIVLTHETPKKPTKGDTTFVFVSDGIESALAQARAAAGDKDIALGGGADISRQYLEAGLVDEIQIHLVPVLFSNGLRLFEHLSNAPVELESTRVIESTGVTHLQYRVIK